MIAQALWKTDVIKDNACSRSLRLQCKPRDRICAFGPGDDAPSLNDSLIGNQFEVAANDVSFEKRERAADVAIDFRSASGKIGELFGIKKRLVNFLRTGVEIDFLVNRDRLVGLRRNERQRHRDDNCRKKVSGHT